MNKGAYKIKLLSPNLKARVEAAKARWDHDFRYMREVLEESNRITAADLAIRMTC